MCSLLGAPQLAKMRSDECVWVITKTGDRLMCDRLRVLLEQDLTGGGQDCSAFPVLTPPPPLKRQMGGMSTPQSK